MRQRNERVRNKGRGKGDREEEKVG